jgi:hypothetical protein
MYDGGSVWPWRDRNVPPLAYLCIPAIQIEGSHSSDKVGFSWFPMIILESLCDKRNLARHVRL